MRIYKTIILSLVLCGCETWSLTLREDHRLRVLENRVLMRIFGPKRDEVTGRWRKLRNEELHDFYSSQKSNEVKENEVGGACSTNGGERNAYRLLVGKPEGRRPLGRPRRRWLNIIENITRKMLLTVNV
jgi:hypothetical protein